jgi:hypothetical protein
MSQWPFALRGVTETVVTTRGPRGRWNAAALGLKAGPPVSARTWGRTRTRRNFERREEGYINFINDPGVFVEAALGISEHDQPILDAAGAWVRVGVDRQNEGTEAGTEWVEWVLEPREADVTATEVPHFHRGRAAVVEATVAASRLDVSAYDREILVDRLDYLADVVETCGGDAEKRAMRQVVALSGWTPAGDIPFLDGNESF